MKFSINSFVKNIKFLEPRQNLISAGDMPDKYNGSLIFQWSKGRLAHCLNIPSLFVVKRIILGQIRELRRDKRDNSHIISMKNIPCDPSLEQAWKDGSDKGSQHVFSWKIKKIIPTLSLLPFFFYLEH